MPKHVYLYAVKGKQALASCVLLHHIGFQDRAHHSAEVHLVAIIITMVQETSKNLN